ncbi:MAG: GNAT family N-acetyltransferase [Pseudomonas sp.]|nr:GNAT family N-acetyltransferase [Pseudomonas sp.]
MNIGPLDVPQRPLLAKFYKAHRSAMRAPAQAQPWVARAPHIIGGLCLTPVADGVWLTGLLVDPACRGQGVASQLIGQALAQQAGAVWLFCHPDLMSFYARSGFAETGRLPPPLADRLARYQRSKPLLAMVRLEPPARSTEQKV